MGKMQSPKSPTKVTVDHTFAEAAVDLPIPSKKTSGESPPAFRPTKLKIFEVPDLEMHQS